LIPLGQPILGQNLLAFRNGLKYHNSAFGVITGTICATFCAILVKIGAVTSEFKTAKNENLPRLGCSLTIIVHLARWRSETDWNITILISAR